METSSCFCFFLICFSDLARSGYLFWNVFFHPGSFFLVSNYGKGSQNAIG
jgi:hypothetical protein